MTKAKAALTTAAANAEVLIRTTYVPALNEALAMMDGGVEPRSALKQAASDHGVAYGDDMGDFVEWAEFQLYGQ